MLFKKRYLHQKFKTYKVKYSDQRKRKLKNEINALQEALNEVKSELKEKD